MSVQTEGNTFGLGLFTMKNSIRKAFTGFQGFRDESNREPMLSVRSAVI